MDLRTNRKKILEEVYARAFEFEQKYGSCPQCVLGAIHDMFETVDPAVFKAAYALGGGVALTTDGTCGALAGGVMALCCKYGRTRENFAKGRYVRSLELAKELHDRFIQEYGSCICRDVHRRIFGRSFNLWDPKEFKEFEREGAHKDKCPGVVGNVAVWVAEMLLREDRNTCA
jgi:C_GCAxxG_C_C family probable redox protein